MAVEGSGSVVHTHRQAVEAAVYDARVRDILASLSDADLKVDGGVPPFPNREHVNFLSFALQRMGPPACQQVLEVGCGTGALSVYLSLNGATVKGIDVSLENVGLATRRAELNGVADRAVFEAVPVEQLADPDGGYDTVIGNQVLHHFELTEAMPNIRRLLRPGGRALFCEPVLLLPDAVRRVRDSAIVKRWLPKRVDTPTERSVSPRDLAVIQQTFPAVTLYPFQLLARLQDFMDLSDTWFGRLSRLDPILLRRFPPFRRLARFVVFELSAHPVPKAEAVRL